MIIVIIITKADLIQLSKTENDASFSIEIKRDSI